MTINQRVEALRVWMHTHQVDAYIVPTADPHNDEYIPAHWMCREWLTGFTGSAGLAIVTAARAALWTDSRYWLQAEAQLDGTPFSLMREGAEGVPSAAQWLHDNLLGTAARTACPPDMLTADLMASLGITPADCPDAFATLWPERPALPAAPITVQPEAYAGLTVAQKLDMVRSRLQLGESRRYLFNDLADIAWMLNLRGSDIPYNPVFMAYVLYDADTRAFTLFTHGHTLQPAARAQLSAAGVAVAGYDEAAVQCQAVPTACSPTAAWSVSRHCTARIPSPVGPLRAVKTAAEQEGFRRAMLADGVAMVRFLRWLDACMAGGQEVTELTADRRLTALRAECPDFCEPSFATIAGYAAHGAIVHYEADEASAVRLEPRGLLLLDSGGQYVSGTTDITRTIALGPVTEEESLVYTLVLKGHLALARLCFPDGAVGLQLDLAARQYMWQAGYDFGHGTGHGVGSHLCVHEGPHQIRKDVRACTTDVPFRAGMTITDEPGVYVAGRFGVRIENTLLCVPGRVTDFGRFLRFESLTLCPYDLRPVRRDMLTAEEVAQIDSYHALVRSRLLPLLPDEADRQWLEQATRPLGAA